MTMHLNSCGLRQHGYNMVAAYECFTKGEPKLSIECYTNGSQYLVRSISRGKAWDIVYTNKEDANCKVKQLWSLRNWHKRIL